MNDWQREHRPDRSGEPPAEVSSGPRIMFPEPHQVNNGTPPLAPGPKPGRGACTTFRWRRSERRVSLPAKRFVPLPAGPSEVSMVLPFPKLRAATIVAGALVISPLVSLPAQGRSSPAEDPDVQGAARLFSAWLEGQIAFRNLPGVVVGVVADQELVWAAGFGFADTRAKTPMTPGTKFRMASHSKLFTATAIMQLREQGKLRLDDPVSKYLPWFRVKPAEPDDPPVTIEELLTHSSGLPREAGAHWTTYEFPTEEQLKSLMAERQAAFPPEVRFKYSNLAYTLAGKIVESVSGERWADYVRKNIFEPLALSTIFQIGRANV